MSERTNSEGPTAPPPLSPPPVGIPPRQQFEAGVARQVEFSDKGTVPTHLTPVSTGPSFGRFALLGAIVLVAGIGGFAVWRALANPSNGAETPQAAADQLFNTLDDEDLIGMLEIMLPSERESIVEPWTDVLVELARLDIVNDNVVDSGGNLSDFSGYDIEIPEAGEPGQFLYDVIPMGTSDTIHWVVVTDGTAVVTFEPTVLRDAFGGRIAKWIDASANDDDLMTQTESVDLAELYANGEPLQFAIVEEDGEFYASLYYTALYLNNNKVAPDFNRSPEPVGADSPEKAAVDFVDNFVDLDSEGVMTMMDPKEFQAVYDFWPTFGPDLVVQAESFKQSANDEGVSWDMISAEAKSEDRNGRTVAYLTGVEIQATNTSDISPFDLRILASNKSLNVTGTVDRAPFTIEAKDDRLTGSGVLEGQAFEVDIDLGGSEGSASYGDEQISWVAEGECYLVTANGESESICEDELSFGPSGLFSVFGFQEDFRGLSIDEGPPGFTVVERDGRWFVSGQPTIVYALVDYLSAIDEDEFNEMLDGYESWFDSLSNF